MIDTSQPSIFGSRFPPIHPSTRRARFVCRHFLCSFGVTGVSLPLTGCCHTATMLSHSRCLTRNFGRSLSAIRQVGNKRVKRCRCQSAADPVAVSSCEWSRGFCFMGANISFSCRPRSGRNMSQGQYDTSMQKSVLQPPLQF